MIERVPVILFWMVTRLNCKAVFRGCDAAAGARGRLERAESAALQNREEEEDNSKIPVSPTSQGIVVIGIMQKALHAPCLDF